MQYLDKSRLVVGSSFMTLGKGNNGKHMLSSSFNHPGGQDVFSGTIVADSIGSGGFLKVLAVGGARKGRSTQRLIMESSTGSSPNYSGTVEFALPERNSQSESGGNLEMIVYPQIVPPSVDGVQAEKCATLALQIGPGSCSVLSTNDPRSSAGAANDLGVDWGQLINVGLSIAPVIGNAGLEIIKSLTQAEEQKQQTPQVFPILAAVSLAGIAVDIAGKILPLVIK